MIKMRKANNHTSGKN